MANGAGAGPAPYAKRNTATRARLAEVVFELRAQGLSYGAIDDLSQNPDGPTGGHRVSRTSARELVREECANRVDPKILEYRAIELARYEAALDRLQRMEESIREVMARKHVTVNNGRVIYIGDEPMQDDTFVLQAVDRLRNIEEQRRKTDDSICRLLGLNAPARVEATVTEVTQTDVELAELIREAKAKNATEEASIKGEAQG